MPEDLPLLLTCLAVAVPVGLVVGLAMRLCFPSTCKRYATWANGLPWWQWALNAAFFMLMALAQVGRGWYSFAVLFAMFGVLQLVALVTKSRAITK